MKATETKPIKKAEPLLPKVGKWIDNNILPYIAFLAMILSTAYTAVSFVGRVNALPEQAQGAIALVVVAFVTSRAVKAFKKLKK